MNKVTIIGTGSVGSTIAYTLAVTGLASEIVMIDVNKNKAMGEAQDIRQGTPFCTPCNIYAGDYPDTVGSNIVIITSGIARRPGQSRLDLAQTNINITKSIIPEITRYATDAIYIVVSNPVDILTYTFTKLSGLPEHRIIGSGTILDTSRLRACLADFYNINQKNVHAYVMGEHGDSAFIPWSLANISNVPIAKMDSSFAGVEGKVLDFADTENYVRKSGARVIECKGATFYAVSVSVCHICQCLLDGANTTMTVSTMMHGEYGINDVCLSVLNIVGSEGAQGKVLPDLTDDEIIKLRYSSDCLKNIIKDLEI